MGTEATCGAKARDGGRCANSPMPNGRCRLHGGMSPGPPRGNRNAWKHGAYSHEYKSLKQFEREVRRGTKL